MQPIDTAWSMLKARTIRDQAGDIGDTQGRRGMYNQPRTFNQIDPPEPGPARSTRTNRMKREIDRQRQDAERGEARDPLDMFELEDMESRPPEAVDPIDASEFDPKTPEQKAAIREYIEQMMQGGFPPKM
jgi:hypothetical protein